MKRQYTITGIRHQMGYGLSEEERQERAWKLITTRLNKGTKLLLAAEPTNPRDPNAVAVYLDFKRIGYISKSQSPEVKQLLNNEQRECEVISHDSHATVFIQIEGVEAISEEIPVLPRQLPPFPLPYGITVQYTDEELAVEVLIPHLLSIQTDDVTVDNLLHLGNKYMELSFNSLYFKEDVWLDRVMEKFKNDQQRVYSITKKDKMDYIYNKVYKRIRDMRRNADEVTKDIFRKQLNLLREQRTETLEEELKEYIKNSHKTKEEIALSLKKWFESMPHADLQNYSTEGPLAPKIHYLRLSRQELQEICTAILILEKYERYIGETKAQVSDDVIADAVESVVKHFVVAAQWVAVYRILVDYFDFPKNMKSFVERINGVMGDRKLQYPIKYQSIQKSMNDDLREEYVYWKELAKEGNAAFNRQKKIADELYGILKTHIKWNKR